MLTLTFLAIILTQSVLMAYFFKSTQREREETLRRVTEERAELLQRIQAPREAVVQHTIAGLPPDPLPLPFDDDEAFHESREELARRLDEFERNPIG